MAKAMSASEVSHLGRYELLVKIGSGGTAAVYLARTEVVGGVYRDVAVKLIHPHIRALDREGAAMLVNEAKLAARIRHPNVVGVQEVGDAEAGVYLVMDYVEGETLSGLVRAEAARDSRVPLRIAARILCDALAGLHAAHELRDEQGQPLGIVHRDFTPSNILVGVDGTTKLTDFGIAKASSRKRSTATGQIKGKIGYMSPELVRGEPLDRRADVWAAGVVAWECLASRRLYGEGDEVRRLFQIVNEVPPVLSAAGVDAPPSIERAIAWALTPDKSQRFSNAEQLRAALYEGFSGGPGIADQGEVAAYVDELTRNKLAQRRAKVAEVLLSRSDHGFEEDEPTRPDYAPAQSIAARVPRAPQLRMGEVVGDRFVIEEPARQTPVGAIYKAVDRATGESIAIKLLHVSDPAQERRFERESASLGRILHPNIVRQVAQGRTAGGLPFHATRWLEGETLSSRLERGPLSIEETLALLTGLAAGLATLHDAGIVHRDIQPSNIFLEDGKTDAPVILDLGVSRDVDLGEALTTSGALLGTVGYMAPEQLGGGNFEWSRVDVFGLGCVVYECLTGQQPFGGVHAIAVLTRLLLEEPAPLGTLRPETPPALASLIEHMLAKDPGLRPADARAVALELASLELQGPAPGSHRPQRGGVSEAEQDFVSLILIEPGRGAEGAPLRAATRPERQLIIRAARDAGGEAYVVGTAMLALLRGTSSSAERAARAVACARTISSELPRATIAVATGFAEHRGEDLVGPTVDRACALLAESGPGIVVDEATRALTVGQGGSRSRSLLGVATQCRARETEVGLIESLARRVVEERTFRSVLITAAPGVGKSRLLDEIAARVDAPAELTILRAQGDSFASRAPFRLVRQILRGALGGVERRLDLNEHRSTQDFHVREALAEILGVDLGAAPSAVLEASRNDPRLRADFMREGFRRWLVGFASERPLVLLLDDLQWGDAPSFRYLDDAARAELPILIVAASREASSAESVLWPVHHTIALSGLPKRAAESLLAEVLPQTPDATVRRLVDRAGGNAFFLEELVRWVARGGDPEAMPPSAVAVAVDRFAALEPHERRLLRAASVFGEHFLVEGALAVLDDADLLSGEAAFRLVERLRRAEVLDARAGGVFSFRHAFLQEAAYAALPMEERARAHAAAAAWLEEAGETDPLVLSNHYERAGDMVGWKRWVREALLMAFASSDFVLLGQLAVSVVQRGATGEDLGFARAMQAVGAAARARSGEALDAGREALRLLKPGSMTWFLAVGVIMFAAGADVEHSDQAVTETIRAYLDLPVQAAVPGRAHGGALLLMTVGALILGQPEVAWRAVARGYEIISTHGDRGSFRGWLLCSERLAHRLGDVGRALRSYDEAIEIFRLTSDRLGEASARFFRVQTRLDCGLSEGIEEDLVAHGAFSVESGLVTWVVWGELHPALAAIRRGDIAAARAGATPHADSREPYPRAVARSVLAECARLDGDLATAKKIATQILRQPFAEAKSLSACVLGRVLLQESRPDEAASLAAQAIAEADAAATYLSERAALRALLVTALAASGRDAEAEQAKKSGNAWALRIATSLDEIPGGREAWLATSAVASLRAS